MVERGKHHSKSEEHGGKEKGRKKPKEIIEFNRHDLMKIYHRFDVKRQKRQTPCSPAPTVEVQLERIESEKKKTRYRAALGIAIPEVLASDMNAMNPQDAFRKVGRAPVLVSGENPKNWEVLPIVYRPGKAPRKFTLS